LLSRLDREQPVPGAHIIVLSEHVHYWGRLGLNDRLSSPIFTRRQAKYVRSLDLDGPYTPQVIINGKLQAVGSDPPRSSM
jgi:hypothetical protein